MYNGYNKVFWGIVIVTFHINLGMVKIVPPFIGFAIILSGVSLLYKETNIESFERAKMFTIIKITISIIGEVMEALSIELTNFFMLNEVWMVFHSVIELLIFYKLFEAAIEHFNNTNSFDLAEETIRKLKSYIIVSVIGIIFLNFSYTFNIAYLKAIVGIAFLILRIYLMTIVNGFKKHYISEV